MVKLAMKYYIVLLGCAWMCITHRCWASSDAASENLVGRNLPRGPFHPKDPAKLQTELVTAEALDSLHRGRPYKVQKIKGLSGTGLFIQDVHAPPSAVWEVLLDFGDCPTRMPKLLACQTYQVTEQARRTLWFTEMTIGFRLFSLNLFVKHEYHPKEKAMVWTLDETRPYELASYTGYWYVERHPTNEGWSRVTYYIHTKLLDWIPSFVLNFMIKEALVGATSWVKTSSEAHYQEERRRRAHEHMSSSSTGSNNPGLIPSRTEEADPSSSDTSFSCDTKNGGVVCPNNHKKSASLFSSILLLESPRTSPPPQIGFSRYFLVSSVMGLLFFNIYLYFSHYR